MSKRHRISGFLALIYWFEVRLMRLSWERGGKKYAVENLSQDDGGI